jgi:hypothetical protein
MSIELDAEDLLRRLRLAIKRINELEAKLAALSSTCPTCGGDTPSFRPTIRTPYKSTVCTDTWHD